MQSQRFTIFSAVSELTHAGISLFRITSSNPFLQVQYSQLESLFSFVLWVAQFQHMAGIPVDKTSIALIKK